MCDQNQAIKILEDVYHSCAPILRGRIQDAFLYGSYARGDYHAESDVDILLTVDLDAEEISDLWMELAEASSDLSLRHDITVSVAVKPVSQFLKYSHILPYYKNILKEGIRYGSR